MLHLMSTTVNFACKILLWYLFSAYFNVYNKIVLVTFPFPWFLATIQSAVGVVCVAPVYLKPPFGLNKHFLEICWNLRYVALLSCLSNVSGTMAVNAGTIHLAQTIKAAEPIFTCVAYVLTCGKQVSSMHWLSFLIIVLGALVASRFESEFVWMSVTAGVVSNTCAGFRSVISKDVMLKYKDGDLLNPKTFYFMLTLTSFFILLPITLAVEGSAILERMQSLVNDSSSSHRTIVVNVLLSAVLFHLYNEFSFQTLDTMKSPVSYAIANSFRRVAIIVLSVVILQAPWTIYGMLGSLVSVLGVFLYSVC